MCSKNLWGKNTFVIFVWHVPLKPVFTIWNNYYSNPFISTSILNQQKKPFTKEKQISIVFKQWSHFIFNLHNYEHVLTVLCISRVLVLLIIIASKWFTKRVCAVWYASHSLRLRTSSQHGTFLVLFRVVIKIGRILRSPGSRLTIHYCACAAFSVFYVMCTVSRYVDGWRMWFWALA